MKKCFFATAILMFAFHSCGSKFYQKKDYPFYDEHFKLNGSVLLKTNGIYVLENIWTSANGGAMLPLKHKKAYQFYDTGQSNFYITDDNLKLDEEYAVYFNQQIEQKDKNTLFQGYYKLKDNKIIIQNVNVALRHFNYTYGFLENDKLIIVKENITEGNGKFVDKYFTETYKETYLFKQIDNQKKEYLSPNW